MPMIPGMMPMMMPPFMPGMMPPPPVPGSVVGQQEVDDDDEYEENEDGDQREPFRIYAQNSLLAQLPEKNAAGVPFEKSQTRRGNGPLIQLEPEVRQQHEKQLAARQTELFNHSIGLGATVKPENAPTPGAPGAYNPYHGIPNHDPLVNMKAGDKFAKPKIEGGLLGEVDRWEKEKEMLKKMGMYRPAMGPSAPPTYLQGGPRPGWGGAMQPGMMQQGMMQAGMMQPGMMQPMMPPGMMMPPAGQYGYPPQGYPAGYPGYPGPPTQMGNYGIPPMPPMQGPNPYYPASEYAPDVGWEDPVLNYHHQMMRERWLEAERMKEHQRMVERGEMPPVPMHPYGMPPQPPPGMMLAPQQQQQAEWNANNRPKSIASSKGEHQRMVERGEMPPVPMHPYGMPPQPPPGMMVPPPQQQADWNANNRPKSIASSKGGPLRLKKQNSSSSDEDDEPPAKGKNVKGKGDDSSGTESSEDEGESSTDSSEDEKKGSSGKGRKGKKGGNEEEDETPLLKVVSKGREDSASDSNADEPPLAKMAAVGAPAGPGSLMMQPGMPPYGMPPQPYAGSQAPYPPPPGMYGALPPGPGYGPPPSTGYGAYGGYGPGPGYGPPQPPMMGYAGSVSGREFI
ncbi:hypothetical protein HDU76_009119, partial [Blyttiomyces sp. JEL0837]